MHWNRAQLDISTCSSLSQLSPVVTKYLPYGAVIPSSDGGGSPVIAENFLSFFWDRLQVVAVTPFDHKSICTGCLVGHNLSQSSWGPTQTICSHAQTDWRRFANNCHYFANADRSPAGCNQSESVCTDECNLSMTHLFAAGDSSVKVTLLSYWSV